MPATQNAPMLTATTTAVATKGSGSEIEISSPPPTSARKVPEPAEDRLAALRAPDDLVVDEVGVQRPVGLVGDEVGREEHAPGRSPPRRSRSTKPSSARARTSAGVAAMMNGRRLPSGVRSRSDHAPTTSGSHSAMRPSPPMSRPMTIDESEKSSASTGRYVETVVIARASAKVGHAEDGEDPQFAPLQRALGRRHPATVAKATSGPRSLRAACGAGAPRGRPRGPRPPRRRRRRRGRAGRSRRPTPGARPGPAGPRPPRAAARAPDRASRPGTAAAPARRGAAPARSRRRGASTRAWSRRPWRG